MANGKRIQASQNGPYLIAGPLTIVDPQGNELSVPEDEAAALCRCGASTTKPFCDGTHSKIGFDAAEAAVGNS
ncbi:CDGSH iron-sulfur domain-containing protein [Egibacter rhizosphaerae]|uniref:CDGSH iron-sulfur domain-containing protein n=1 Tax=Egibacter rhizosphaerae TaxID=1670831 RepID=A0A411YIE7_9ACTN|nr:CDGSH iron-sulfur domain-containing protein [Egibacter rhizosphaerae]QBI21085.1 CDGSH iron-sulfur domain-containing protein [Egibacter rhizosphaerae]